MADRSSLSTDLQSRIDRVYENLIGIKQQHQNDVASPSALDAVFDAMDSNNDGVVDRAEWDAHIGSLAKPTTPQVTGCCCTTADQNAVTDD